MTEHDPLRDAIGRIARNQELSSDALSSAFDTILSGNALSEQIGAFLMGLAVRGETGTELLAGAQALRSKARTITLQGPHLDTCGTGGLGWTSLNTSTASAIVTAACGAKVAKHGNRSVPPKTGSADVLEALGVAIEIDEGTFRHCVDTAGVGFLFARSHHSAMRHVAGVRANLGIRTIFNLLGPLSNPASASHQILGVSEERWLEPMAQALQSLGVTRALVVHGTDPSGQSIDELSIAGRSLVMDVSPTAIEKKEISPNDAGLSSSPLSALEGGSPSENAQAIRELLDGRSGPFRDAVVLNAAAGLLVLDKVSDLQDGVCLAQAAIDNGNARKTLGDLVEASKSGAA